MGIYQEDPRSQKRDLGHPSFFSIRFLDLDRLCSLRVFLILLARLRRGLRLRENSDKPIKIGGIHVTHSDNLQVVRGRGVDGES